MKAGAWSEPMPVGVARELFAVEAAPLGGVAVAGQAGALSVRTLVGPAQWRWLPGRAVTWSQLNAVWTGVAGGGEESVVVGKHGTFLRRSGAGGWSARPLVAAADFRDELSALAISPDGQAMWVGGTDGSTAEGVLYQVDPQGVAGTWRLAGTAVTSVGASATHVTLAAKRPYQLLVDGGLGLEQQALEEAVAVWSPPSGARACFAGLKGYSLGGSGSSGGTAGATQLLGFPGGSYRALAGLLAPDAAGDVTGLYAAVAEKKAYYLANADATTAVQAVTTALDEAPLALGVVSAGKFWVVGERGLAQLVGASTEPGRWAGTNHDLRGIAVSPLKKAVVVGDQGAILSRAPAMTD